MKLEYLPTEDDKTFTMYAFYDETKNEVIWNGCTNLSSYMDLVAGTEYAQFLVWRRRNIVVVEGCGWYDSDFHFRFELTHPDPSKVVILAHTLAGLMDQADEGEINPSLRG